MSSKIRILSETVANMIAAGEVVERPASVVKELVENALDAGARRVLVDLENGGKRLIRVVDDGEGMNGDDALLAVERHATSKIRTEKDLFAVSTMGFRGEALAAIASVSRFTLRTATAGAAAGTKVFVEGGLVRETGPDAVPQGTDIAVADLFFNTPGRRKFLRAPETELTHAVETMIRLALPRTDAFFRLRHDGGTILQVAGNNTLPERIAQLLGPDAARGLVNVDYKGDDFHLRGFVSGPEVTRSSTQQFFVYCNGRFLRDRLITHAINSGYRGHVLKGRYPIVVLMIEIDPELVDVNVHPTKSEVRFRKPSGVYEGIVEAIDKTLRGRFGSSESAFGLRDPAFTPPPGVDAPAPENRDAPAAVDFSERQRVMETLDAFTVSRTPSFLEPPSTRGTRTIDVEMRAAAEHEEPAGVGTTGDDLDAGVFAGMAVVGQVFDNYIVCETRQAGGMLVVIDAHAAHERILFERLKNDYFSHRIPVQAQLVPIALELRRTEADALLKAIPALSKVGVEVEPFGGSTFRITGIPTILSAGEAEAAVRECVEKVLETGRVPSADHVADDFLSVVACHSAVRTGQELTTAQMREILLGLDRIRGSGSCPHGRPTLWSIPLYDIEKRFKRR